MLPICFGSDIQILCYLMMFYQIFLSPQVKRNASFSNKQSLYELPHKVPSSLRLRILGCEAKSEKFQNLLEL